MQFQFSDKLRGKQVHRYTARGRRVVLQNASQNESFDSRNLADGLKSPSDQVVQRLTSLFACLNSRNFSAAASFMDENISYKAANQPEIMGRYRVLGYYESLLGNVPQDTAFVLESMEDIGEGVSLAKWHVELSGLELPWSQISSTYSLNPVSGRLQSIRDSTSLPSNLVLPALTVASPLVGLAKPLVPAVRQVSGVMGDLTGLVASSVGSIVPGGGPLPSFLQAMLNPSSSSNSSAFRGPTSSEAGSNSSPAVQDVETGNIIRGRGDPASQVPLFSPDATAASSHSSAPSAASTPSTSGPQSDYSTLSGTARISNSTPSITNLSGVWKKDLEVSDLQGFDRMLALLGLNSLQRVTARLIEGVEIKHVQGNSFVVAFLTVVPFFRVEETIKFGSIQSLPRRDLQPGTQRATAEEVLSSMPSSAHESGGSTASEGAVKLTFDWGAPNSGSLQEVYRMQDGMLLVHSTLDIGGRIATVKQVYKLARSREEVLNESKKRNTSLQSVLERQSKEFKAP
ncbi:hypothetical protein CEUSTIGMA_g3812.t1 [Chlamydomonas eustigma]|uniref:Uncharacterized protein n=1 Tax=Chlamydomonas eustigma TaxID=1157962 RepID=A0A250WZZ1_9CHLO|nr:hypothetical protein CEUSTIGMA_g3812.t1 [Chlamydomonas eustigma]|eukprot:GAX76366.1 hypothetical protein CEUSTIGMA_g3812.t1 [Chlamydomonas eustigma]